MIFSVSLRLCVCYEKPDLLRMLSVACGRHLRPKRYAKGTSSSLRLCVLLRGARPFEMLSLAAGNSPSALGDQPRQFGPAELTETLGIPTLRVFSFRLYQSLSLYPSPR
jgi:hypothetical protein